MKWTPRRLKFLLNIYPPYRCAGIRVKQVATDWSSLHVIMNLRWYNRNAVGTHFGGSLYSMVDPHVMLLLMQLLGPKYIVWDQAAEIKFIKPGKGRVHSRIKIDHAQVEAIKSHTADGRVYRPTFELEIVDDQNEIVAWVQKVLYVKLKSAAKINN